MLNVQCDETLWLQFNLKVKSELTLKYFQLVQRQSDVYGSSFLSKEQRSIKAFTRVYGSVTWHKQAIFLKTSEKDFFILIKLEKIPNPSIKSFDCTVCLTVDKWRNYKEQRRGWIAQTPRVTSKQIKVSHNL